MNAHLDYPLDEVLDMSEPAELPDAEEPEVEVPLGIEAEEPTIADDIKQDDAAANEVPTSIDSSDEDEDEIDEDDEEDFDDDEDEDDEDELDEDDDELDTSREDSVDIDLK